MRNKNGVTLLELIVVMAITLVLCLLAYPVIIKTMEKGEKARCINQMRQLGVAMTMHLYDHDRYPRAARYARSGEAGSIINSLAGYIDDPEVFICPSSETQFKQEKLSYIYNTGARDTPDTNQWLLVDARLPGSPNPHRGNRATVSWSDGHAGTEEVVLPNKK